MAANEKPWTCSPSPSYTYYRVGFMARIVGLSTDKYPGEQVFVSLEDTPLVLSDVRRELPQLKRELRKKWQVLHVEIENRIPRRKNPHIATELVRLACVGVVVSFALPAAKAAGTKIGEAVGEEIAVYVRGWIRRVGRGKSTVKKSAHT